MNKIVSLYRHLVKGLGPESLQKANLHTNGTLYGDRAFAFQFLDEAVPAELKSTDAKNASWMPKFFLAVQHDWPDLARVLPLWNDAEKTLKLSIDDGKGGEVEESVDSPEGREKLATFLENYLKTLTPFAKARHPQVCKMRLIGDLNSKTRYTDSDKGPISFAFRETILDLEKTFGFPVDERRFRLNFFLTGAPAWTELSWVGKKFRVGKCILQVYKPIGRCPNIDVNQETGVREDEIFPQLKAKYGHSLTGVRADILEGGELNIGDKWELLD